MKSAKFLNLIVLGLVLTLPLVGCKRKPGYLTKLPEGTKFGQLRDDPGSGGMLGGNVGQIRDRESTTGFALPEDPQFTGWPENREMFKAQTVYFDFDSSVVKGSEKTKLSTVASHLKANPSHALRVEGHCDERGTEEYNRALGERRALAVREALIAEGASPDRVVTISYGEDKPADPGHNEAAWRKNRRGESVLLTPP